MFDDRDRPTRRWNPPPGWGVPPPTPAPRNRVAAFFLAAPTAAVTDPAPKPDPLARLKAEPPGPDGVRAGLVARVRELIAEGAYDAPDRWRRAEQLLLDRLRER